MKAHIIRGIVALLVFFFVAASILSVLAFQRADDVNTFLNLKAPSVLNEDAGLQHYKSEFTDDGLLSEDGMNRLIETTDAFVVTEAEEGAVLLLNRNGALPLSETERSITLFGRASADPIFKNKSGGPVTVGSPRLLTYHDAFVEAGFSINETLFDAYQKSGNTRVKYGTDTVTNNSSSTKSYIAEEDLSFYTDTLQATFASYGDAAIVLFAREAGEGTDIVSDPSHESSSVPQLSLHQEEADLLKMINQSEQFKKTIVLINSCNMMDLDWASDYETYGVDALLYIGQPGTTGFLGIVNLLTGKSVPSGRLSDTIATDSLSSPAMQNLGDYEWTNVDYLMDRREGTIRSEKYLVYAEGIYVGYKYYETRYFDSILGQYDADSPVGRTETHSAGGETVTPYPDDMKGWDYAVEMAYPFGFGLSYTTFSQDFSDLQYDMESDTFIATVSVTNTGDTYSGKSVVELYVSVPYTEYDRENLLEKSAIQLVGFGKTGILAPGQCETVTITVPRYFLASYDRNGSKTYILDAGEYYFAIGDDAHDAINNVLARIGGTVKPLVDHLGNRVSGDIGKVKVYTVESFDDHTYAENIKGNKVTNLFTGDAATDINSFVPETVTYLTRGGGGNTWATSYPKTVSVTLTDHMIYLLNGLVYETPEGMDDPKTVPINQDQGIKLSDMIGVEADDPKWNTFIEQLSIGELVMTMDDYKGFSEPIEKIGRTKIIHHSDGPNGLEIRYDIGEIKDATCYVSECLTSGSFNAELMRRRGELIGEECLYAGCQVFWGPGVNIHRTPYSGRNFEYFSEDPILSYICSEQVCSGMAEKGVLTGGKHLVTNDQEINRNGVAIFLTEQALRETYLRPFEIIVSNDNLLFVMCSENRLGLTSISLNKTLLTELIRHEWGYKGVIISDAANDLNYMHPREGVAAGTDMWCLTKKYAQDIRKYLQSDAFLITKLQEAGKHTYYAYVNSNYVNGLTQEVATADWTPWWQPFIIAADAFLGILFVAATILFVRTSYGKKRKAQ